MGSPLVTSIAQLIRALHRHRDVTDSSPEFFRPLFAIAKIVFTNARIITSLEASQFVLWSLTLSELCLYSTTSLQNKLV